MRASILSFALGILFIHLFTTSSFGQSRDVIHRVDSMSLLANEIGLRNLDSVRLLALEITDASLKANYEFGVIKGKVHAAYYLLSRNQPDTAKYLLNECLAYFDADREHQNSLEHATTLYYLSVLAMRSGDYSLSEEYGFKASTLFEELNSPENVANTLRNIGTGKFNRNLYSQALTHFLEALKIKLKAGLPPEKATPELRLIAQVYEKMGQHETALEYHRRIVRIYKERNLEHRLYEIYYDIGGDFQHMHEYDSSLHYYNLSLIGAEKRSNFPYQIIIKLGIAKTLALKGHYSASNKIILEVTHDKNPSERPWTREFYELLGSNHLKLGNLTTAIHNARLAYEAKGGMEDWQMLASASYTLYSAYEKKGELDSALYYLKKFSSHNDSLYNISHQKQLSSLYAEIENLEKGLQLEEMSKRQQISDLQNSRLRWIIVLSSSIALLIITLLILIHRIQKREQRIAHEKLQEELNQKKKDLYQQALHMIHLNNGYKQIEDNLKKIKAEIPGSKKDVQHVLRTIHMTGALEKEWDHFNEYFGSVHTDFFDNLHAAYPKFTLLEKRLAGLIRMNMSNGEIARIMNIETASVKQAKYRLKRKLQLGENEDIYDFLIKL